MFTVGGSTQVRYVVDVRGRIPDRTLPPGLMEQGGLHLYSVLRVRLRDDAALYGLLRRIQGLALTLTELRRADPPAGDDAPRSAPLVAVGPVNAEVVVEGGLGDLALDVLRDVCVPLTLDSRLVVDDSRSVGDVLTRLTAEGVQILTMTTRSAPGSSEHPHEEIRVGPDAR